MPTFSEVTLTFECNLVIGDELKLKTVFNNAIYMASDWVWVNSRSSAFQVSTGFPTVTPGERAAINFAVAFILDHATGYVVTVQNTNEVLIQSELEFEFFTSLRLSSDTCPQSIDYDVNNEDPGDLISDITVMIPKYYIVYCDDFNTDRQVIILQRAFIGLEQELLADVNPISISYESSDDFKFSPIRPSTATVFMIFDTESGTQFEEFWTADEREFMVQDVKDGVVEWSGFVIVNGFQYEYHGGLYHASIEANDGLGLLEAITFVDDNQKPYGNQDLVYNNEFEFPFSLIITEILLKLGLSLDLWVCVDSYETSMLKVGDVREADPLSAAFVNVKTYIKLGEDENIPYWFGSGEEWNCKEVLENILYIFGAKIYQEVGVWRLKTINADIDYGSGATQRYWRKYNTAGVYLGNYEIIDDQIEIPCGDSTKYLIENDHVMSMDDVYKAFRMNYEYTFLRFGDTPLNVLKNSDFCDFDNTSILSAPDDWERWRRNNHWYIRIKDIVIPFADAGGHICGIEIGTHKAGIPTQQGPIRTDPNPAIWTSLRSINLGFVVSGSKMSFSIWCKFKRLSTNREVIYSPFFRCILITDSGKYFMLRNTVGTTDRFGWEEVEPLGDEDFEKRIFFYLQFQHTVAFGLGQPFPVSDDYIWYQWDSLGIAEPPESGNIEFHIHGLAASAGDISNNFPSPMSYQFGTNYNDWLRIIQEDWVDEGGNIPRLQITGLVVDIIPEESELPQQQDFIYNNTNENYSLQVDPITVYNGDLQDQFHISNIIVPTNVSGMKNFWDDLGENYGSSSLGLLTVREIMRQYQKPYRILEGSIKIQDARFGTVYTLAVLANVRFLLLRGTFNKQKQFIEDATFVEITSDVLPDGGSEGGNTLDPEWVGTGNVYCQIDPVPPGNGLNTGYVIIEEQDINPNSETFQDTREVVSDSQDFDQCPLSTPRLYYWGSDDLFLNTATLLFSPLTVIGTLPTEIQISFDNEDGNYLYFVHLKTLGVVERIYTNTSPNNVLSDWVYLVDTIIDGYLYRVMRTDYVMAEFSNFTHNFVFA